MSEAYTQGPVPVDSQVYVERAFEREVQGHLLARRWVLLLGPRQHGKTSALIRMKKRLQDVGFRCAFVDLQRHPPFGSYAELLEWVAVRIANELDNSVYQPPMEFHNELTSWLEQAIPVGKEPVIIMIDEASNIPQDEWRNSFYGQLRAISSDRATAADDSIQKRLIFLFSGTFRPETLVDERNSPFNICERIETEDLTRDQAHFLAKQVIEEKGEQFADLAFDLVNGQPFLLQSFFARTAAALPSDRQAAADEAIAQLHDGKGGHFEGIFSKVIADTKLTNIVGRMVKNGSVPNEPANSDFRFLQVIGLAKRNGARLVFRNRIYQELASASPQIRQEAVAVTTAHLFSLPDEAFNIVRDEQLREVVKSAHRGAITCYTSGSYRLSLAGFGCALEGILLDYLRQQNTTVLSTAIQKSRVTIGARQNRTDPNTWDLSSLMKVAKAIQGSGRAVDPPEALRHWRNEIHPAVALRDYKSEDRLEPEARAASGLFDAVRRDLETP